MLALASVRTITATARLDEGPKLHRRSLASPISYRVWQGVSRSILLHCFVHNACSEVRESKINTTNPVLSLVEEAARCRAQAVHAAVMAVLVLFVVFLGVVFGQGAHDGA